MEDPPQDMIINTRSSQLQLEIVEDVPEKTEAPVQSTSAPPAEEVRVHIPMDDPHQDMIIYSRTSKQQTTALAEEAYVETNDANDDDDEEEEEEKYGVIRRLPIHMREDRGGHLYEPVMVSIGPYHHKNKPQYSKMERLKKRLLNKFMEASVAKDATKDKNFYYGKIFDRIKEIRGYYQGVGPEKYTDEALTELILCDACFLVGYMKSTTATRYTIIMALGNVTTTTYVENDLLRVENQIPLLTINLLLHLRFGEDEVDEIVRAFLGVICFQNMKKLKGLPWKGKLPLHLLQAYQATLWKQEIANERPTTNSGEPDESRLAISYIQNRSVTYLQAKGIYFRPSSECLRDITFNSYGFFGVLHLPNFFIGNNTKVLLQNIVAFEYSPEGLNLDADLGSYVNFMNTLIDTSKDVKQLREKGILYSDLGSDEEVLKLFKEINTYGFLNYSTFHEVRRKIDRHCKSRIQTSIADLVQNYCRGPWAAIAILAATVVLCLTAAQTYYAIHPKH